MKWIVVALSVFGVTGVSAQTQEGASEHTTRGILSVVYPFYTSTNESENRTYLRLINSEDFSNEITVDVYSRDLSDDLVLEGSCEISVPAKSAPQLDRDYFEDCADWEPTESETVMRLEFDIGEHLRWQSVIWSPTTGYFGNISTCREPTINDNFVHSVHTTKIVDYPSTLYGLINVNETYQIEINIYDAGNGTLIGEATTLFYSPDRVDQVLVIPFLEPFANWSIPLEDLPFQVNLEFGVVNESGEPITEGQTDIISHFVRQTVRDEEYNMLISCLY